MRGRVLVVVLIVVVAAPLSSWSSEVEVRR